jgi:Domain of Unknown Function (DUF1087).
LYLIESSQSSIFSFEHLPLPQAGGANQAGIFTLKTPAIEKELRRQASSIKALLRTRSRSPPSPSDRTLNQLVKGFRLTMQGAILLAKENKELRAANEKQKQKRTRSRRQIPADTGLTMQEASQLITTPVEADEAPLPPDKEALRQLWNHVRGLYQGTVGAERQGIDLIDVQKDDVFY